MPPVNPPASKQTTQASTRSGGFDFETFQRSVDEQSRLREARQAEQIRVQQEQGRIMKKSADLSNEQFRNMEFLKSNVQKSQQKAEHARKLADSGSFLDTLELLGRQTTDPNGYLREQRQKRLAEDAQQAQILAAYYGYGQDALQKDLMASTANLDVLKTLEAVGAEKLNAFSENAKLVHQNMLASQTLKDDAIYAMGKDQLSAAVQQAKMNPSGTVNIAGIEVDARTIEDRIQVLDRREYDQAVLSTNLRLAQDTAANIDETIADREAERKLNRNKRENVDTDIAIADAKRRADSQILIERAQDNILAGMNRGELNKLRTNSYIDPESGIQYKPAAVEQAYKIRLDAENSQAEEATRSFMLDNFDTNSLAQEAARMDSNMARYESNSLIYKSAQKYQRALHTAALGSGPENGDIKRITAMNIYQSARKEFDESIEKQAALDASNGGRGSVDANLKAMRIAYYRGEPIPQESLVNAASERLTKFKSVADIFPPDVATRVERIYRDELQKRLKRDPTDFANSGSLSATDRKLIEADAVQEAVRIGVKDSIQGITDTILPSQVLDPTHPLHGKSPAEMGNLLLTADNEGITQWANVNKLSPEDAQMILSGGVPKGMSADTAAQLSSQVQPYQNQALMFQLDSIQPGLGNAVAQWWQQRGADYIDRVAGSALTNGDESFQGRNFTAVAGTQVADGFNQYAAALGQSDAAYRESLIKKNSDLLMFGSNPTNAQVAILSADKNLSDPEKQQIFSKVIQPLLQQAEQKGLDFQQTNELIERSLMNNEFKDPEMKSLVKTLRRDRSNVVESMERWKRITRNLYYASPLLGPLPGLIYQNRGAPDTSWYSDLIGAPTAGGVSIESPLGSIRIGKPDLSGVFNR